MSDYLKGQNAWLDDECGWAVADKQSPEFRAGYSNAAKRFPDKRPKITVRSQPEMVADRSSVECGSCGAKFKIEDLFLDDDFMENKQCLKCGSQFPV